MITLFGRVCDCLAAFVRKETLSKNDFMSVSHDHEGLISSIIWHTVQIVHFKKLSSIMRSKHVGHLALRVPFLNITITDSLHYRERPPATTRPPQRAHHNAPSNSSAKAFSREYQMFNMLRNAVPAIL